MVWLICKHSLPCIRGQLVQVLLDIMTVVHYINKQGGAQSLQLCAEAIPVWNWCIPLLIALTSPSAWGSEHPGSFSRHLCSEKEWEFHGLTLQEVFQEWGNPKTDFSVSDLKKTCKEFYSKERLQPRLPG